MQKFIFNHKGFVLLLPVQVLFYFMATEKYYLNEFGDKKIDFYYTHADEICLRFWEQKDCEFSIDLDLETIEEFILDLQFQIQRIKSEGGKNG